MRTKTVNLYTLRRQSTTVNLYTFDELSEKAKSKARQWLADEWDCDYITSGALDSVKAFVALFGGRLGHYKIDWQCPSRTTWALKIDDNVADLSGNRARTWIVNNIPEKVLKCDCELTGVCYDDDLLDGVRKFIKSPDNRNIKDIVLNCLETLNNTTEKEIEYQKYGEGAIETILANEFTFTVDGKREE